MQHARKVFVTTQFYMRIICTFTYANISQCGNTKCKTDFPWIGDIRDAFLVLKEWITEEL